MMLFINLNDDDFSFD